MDPCASQSRNGGRERQEALVDRTGVMIVRLSIVYE